MTWLQVLGLESARASSLQAPLQQGPSHLLCNVKVVDSNLNLTHGQGSSRTGWPEWRPLGVECVCVGGLLGQRYTLGLADCSLSSLTHSRQKASGSVGSPWMTGGSCTSKTPW